MNMHIKEFAELTNVSVRTLHYYDEIGLLKPSFVDEQNGYRCYDEKALERMQQILFYRELDFSLKSISEILSSPNYDKHLALVRQKELLILKRRRLDRLISAIDDSMKGDNTMDTKVFDNTEYENARNEYEQEAKARWGDTKAYREYLDKAKNTSAEKMSDAEAQLEEIFAEFARCMQSNTDFTDSKAQQLAEKLQRHITDNFYNCTKEILSGLAQMYVGDDRFRSNIDRHGKGTAEYASKSIEHYCSK
ncbi:MAG: MerR family transcriptional regulator [Oscillospiraceae bacterium]